MERRRDIASESWDTPPGTAADSVAGGGPMTTGARPSVAFMVRLVAIGLGISVVPLDTSVNIAFPDITGSFHLPIPMIQWVIICYVLANAGPLLAFGRVGDLWGHARVFRAGLAWNVIAFLLCAAAPSFGWLLFCRFLQGIGAALIISCAPALVTSLYPAASRSRALGAFTLMFALGSALGPLIGGALVARWGWPAVFWFRAPIALASLLFARGLPSAAAPAGDRHFDIGGATLLAAGLAALLLGINALPRIGRGDGLAFLLLPIAAASLVGFVWWEGRSPQPIVRIELFRNAGFTLVNLAATLMSLVTFSVMLIGPYYIKPRLLDLYGNFWGGLLAGVVLASGFIAMSLTSPPAGALVGRLGAARVATLGAVLVGAGLVLVGSWRSHEAPLVMVAALALQGVGTGCFQVAYIELVMAASPPEHHGVAGSLAMLTRTIGVVVAAAGLTLGFQAFVAGARAAGASDSGAFLAAFHIVFRLCGIAAALNGALVALSARRLRPRRAAPGL